MQRVEFTIEPFVEGQPGPHVTAPVDALIGLGLEVEIGPFGTGCSVAPAQTAAAVSAIIQQAFEHGATHVNIDIAAEDGS